MSIRGAALAALNRTIESIKRNAAGSNTRASVYWFGNRIERHITNVPIEDVSAISSYWPDEIATDLFGAVKMAITDSQIYSNNDINLIMVVTDGGENAGRVSQNELAKMINEVNKTDRYTIAFQLPKDYIENFTHAFPMIPAGNVRAWEQTDQGAHDAAVQQDAGLSNFYAGVKRGVTSTQTFYTDASKITKKSLTKLTDVSKYISALEVKAETPIKPFVDKKVGTYTPGSAFYQLTKPEKIQAGKLVLIQEKGKKQVYSGDQARSLLGLPIGDDCRVKPGNHSKYDIFVQSTSLNRILVRGTKLLIWPQATVQTKRSRS